MRGCLDIETGPRSPLARNSCGKCTPRVGRGREEEETAFGADDVHFLVQVILEGPI